MNGIEAMTEADATVFVVDDDVSVRESLEHLVRIGWAAGQGLRLS